MLFLILVGLAVALGSTVYGVWALARSSEGLARPAWRRVAQRLGGRLVEAGPGSSMCLLVSVDGSRVGVRCRPALGGSWMPRSTEVVAALEARTPWVLRVQPALPLPSAGALVAAPTGDDRFDREHLVLTNNVDLAALWLTADVRAWIARAEGYEIGVSDGRVTARRPHVDDSSRVLEAAIRATALLAARERGILARWRVMARALGGEVSSWSWGFDADGGTAVYLRSTRSGGLPARIDAVQRQLAGPPRLATRVTVAAARPSPDRFDVHPLAGTRKGGELWDRYRLVSGTPEAALERFDPDTRRRIGVLSPDWIGFDGHEVVVWLPGLETRPERLRAALDLASDLAAPPPTGPYR